jgi:hypothetical protein
MLCGSFGAALLINEGFKLQFDPYISCKAPAWHAVEQGLQGL